MEQESCNDRGGNSFFAFLLGGAVGGVLGMLYAPDKGEQTRLKIKFRTEEFADQAVEKMQRVREESTNAFDRARHAFDEQRDRIVTAVDAGKRAFSEEQQHIEENA